MQGTEVSLDQMLNCREQRSLLQQRLRAEYHLPLISFCMNIPGPIKTNPLILAAFCEGQTALLEQLREQEIAVIHCEERHSLTGDELFLAVSGDPAVIKAITTRIEDTHPLGRLFDMDVLTPEGSKLSRTGYRRCLLCGRQAQDCARSRRHRPEELQDGVEALLTSHILPPFDRNLPVKISL